ncbi:MAG TPA: transcriptional repressor [Planctomycetes bacterium]|nr:transcriptional repressor [Planctomycetota bacterium]
MERPRTEAAAIHLAERCRAEGMRVTPQRIAVYEALLASRVHPSPEDIFRTLRSAVPSLSLATVYNALDALESLQLVRKVVTLGEVRRYDANLTPHHHLICTACLSIRDLDASRLSRIRLKGDLDGFQADQISVQILGRCADCTSSAEN